MNEDVSNVVIPTNVFNSVIDVLTQLPYKQVFSLLEEIKKTAKAEQNNPEKPDKEEPKELKAPKQV